MRAVVQRVSSAAVTVGDEIVGQIGAGLLVYLGVAAGDTARDVAYLVNKVGHLRVFHDADGKMNLDVRQVQAACLVVSAFSTQGDARKGHRPAFTAAAAPELADALYRQFCEQLQRSGVPLATGRFRAAMQVQSVNDGPICILVDSAKAF